MDKKITKECPNCLSIDRIDSSRGYVEGNIQLVCHAVNLAKNSWPQDVFIDLCRKIVKKADKEK